MKQKLIRTLKSWHHWTSPRARLSLGRAFLFCLWYQYFTAPGVLYFSDADQTQSLKAKPTPSVQSINETSVRHVWRRLSSGRLFQLTKAWYIWDWTALPPFFATLLTGLTTSQFPHCLPPRRDGIASAVWPASSSSALISERSTSNSSRLRSMKLCVRRDFSRMPFGVKIYAYWPLRGFFLMFPSFTRPLSTKAVST